MGDDSDWLKLPTDEKCQHKAWKARVSGYEEATKLFQTVGDEKSPEFYKYLGLIKKFVIDSNAVAQEKGLEATLAFVENAAIAGKAANEVCNGVIAKCLNQRAKTRDLGMAILMLYIEIEKQEIVHEELMKGLTNKQPKIVSACVVALREALRDFGTKIVSVKPILKQLQTLLEDRDKTVRDETKLLAVEIYRWIGPALKPQITNLKPVQITELEAEFEKLPPSKPVQSRFLRSQQDLKAKIMEQQAMAAEQGDGQSVVEESASSEVIDPYELMDPVDILAKLPADFYDKIEAKKWQDRREVLEAVQKLAENPKLEQGDYSELLRALKKVISKDSNVLLVGIAVKCVGLLAIGLRKKFTQYAVGCVEVLLEKFREKKANIVLALKEAVDAVYATTTLEPISEACVASLDHKTPSVKAETAAFLARCFAKCTPVTLPKKLLKLFVAALLKTVDDAAGEVREASFEALGTAMKVVSEKAMGPFVADVDKIKMDKIKECCEKAVVVGKPMPSQAAKPAPAESVASKPAAPGPSKPGPKINPSGGPPRIGSTGSAAAAKKDSQLPGSSGSSGPGAVVGGAKKKPVAGKGKKPDAKEEQIERELSDEVVEEKMTQLVSSEVLAKLGDANWKERLATVEKLTEALKLLPRDDIPCQAVVRTIMKKPGLKDNNFQVLKLKVDLIGYLALNGVFSKRSAEYCLADLVDKIGDAKNGSGIQETLSCIAEATSLDFVALQALPMTLEQKNPKNQSETFNWLAAAVRQFGFKLTVKPVVDAVNKALASSNPAVRTSAITLLGVMYMYMGPSLRVLFESEKPALLQTIDAEFEKVKGEKPPAPVRGLRKAGASSADDVDGEGDEGEVDSGGGGGGDVINVADLIPRTDISERMRDELLAEIGDKNWKVRKEGLEKVVAILNDAKFITPNIGQLPEALKGRLTDSNKILAGIALTICQTLATAMGPNIKQYVRVLGAGIISNFGDTKPAMRATAVQTLNVWVEQTGLAVFVEAELLVDSLKLENPNLRMELLGWLAEKLPACKKLPPEFGECIPYLFVCLEDRNADVRKKANDAVLPFMIQTGYDAMVRHAAKVKPASKDTIMKILEQARPNLPQKPAKVASSAPAVMTAKQQPSAAKTKVESPDDDDGYSVPAVSKSATVATKGGKVVKPAGGVAASASGIKKPGSTTGAPTGPAAPVAAAASKKKGQEEEDTSPPLKASNGKEQRFKDEKTLKVLKWNFSAPRPEFIDQLRQQMEPTFNRTLVDQMLHIDFKFHIKAIDTLSKVCCEGSGGVEATLSNLDIILKWHTLRFFDTNTTVLMKQLEYLQLAINTAAAEGYHLHEYESVSFIPYLVNKVGDPKDNIRKDVRSIMSSLCKINAPQKMFVFVLDGLKSKNAKQRTECLDELGCLIDSYGVTVCQPSPAVALKQIAQQIGDRDNSVRSAALNTIVVAHSFIGEAVYKLIGTLSDKDLSMLEERIKRSAKSVRASVPAPTAPTQPVTASKLSPDEKHQTKPAPTSRMLQPTTSKTETKLVPAGSGQFRLDLDDNDMSDNYSMPQLIETDLNEILNEPVKLPVTRMRPPSPSMKLLHTSTDAKSAVDLVVSQIASTDVQTSLQALHQIDEVLLDDEKSEAIVTHVDQLLITITLQLRVTYSKHMSIHMDGNTRGSYDSHHDVLRLYKCLLATLLSLCQRKNLIREGTRDVLKDLVFHLITILLDTRLNDLEEGQQVARSVNVTVVRIVEKAEPTNVMSALIKLLQESLGTETYSSQFIELIMKCMWKMVRMLPNLVNELNIDRVLADLHVFLRAFPSQSWKNRPSDLPLRTVKTILHTFVKIKGNRILNHLTLIEHNDHQPSEVESYMRKLLRGTGSADMGTESTNMRNDQLNASSEHHAASSSLKQEEPDRKTQRRISRSIHDTLADIFKKIGSKENTREGLNDLYDFKIQHPDADIDPFLKKSTQFFQDYIERGLKSVELERREKQKSATGVSGQESSQYSGTGNNPTLSVGSGAQASAVTDVSAADYLERLKVLRARCGLDNNDVRIRSGESTTNESTVKARSSATRTLDNALSTNLPLGLNANTDTPAAPQVQSSSTSASVSNIDDLKKRLEKIKNNVKDY